MAIITHEFKYYVLLVLTMAFWGASWPVARVLVQIAPQLTIGFFRFLVASIFFLVLLILVHQRQNRQVSFFPKNHYDLLWFFSLGFVGIFGYGVLFLVGMKFTTAAQGAIIAGINPVSVSIFAHLLHKERFNYKWKYVGFLFSFLGIIFVIGIQALIQFKAEYLIGNLLILTAMAFWGLYSSLGKFVMKKHSSLTTTAGAVFFGAILFGIGSVTEGFWRLSLFNNLIFVVGIVFLGFFVTFLGFYFYFLGVRNIGASRSSIFINLVPIFGTIFSAWMLGEVIYWTFFIGLVLVLIGITIINFPEKRRNQN